MEEILITVAISIAGPALLGIFGLVWRLAHKVNLHEKQIEAHDRRIGSLSNKLEKVEDKAYSIVKNL